MTSSAGIFGYAESDSEDEMPVGWEERTTADGKVYYVNHSQQSTQWGHPRTGKHKKLIGDLPPEWEKRYTAEGRVEFRNSRNGTISYTDPRLAFAVEDMQFEGNQGPPRQRYDGGTKARAILHGMDLSQKTVAITGANTGIGFETAKVLCFHGAHVVLLCSSLSKAHRTAERLLVEKPDAKVDCLECELSSLHSVKRCAHEFHLKKWPLHILILNAAVFMAPFTLTEDGLELTFQVNHLAQFYLFQLLRDIIQKSGPDSRVLFVSSESHRMAGSRCFLGKPLTYESLTKEFLSPCFGQNYWSFSAYNLSKLCNVLTAMELNRQLSSKGVSVNALHPGNLIYTDLSRHSCAVKTLAFLLRPFTKSLEQGSATTVYCAVAPELESVGGRYFNNCWYCDPDPSVEDEKLQRRLWDLSVNILERAMGSKWLEL